MCCPYSPIGLMRCWEARFLTMSLFFFFSQELCALKGTFPTGLKPSPAGQQSYTNKTWGPVNLSGQMWGFGATARYAGMSANCLCAKQLPSIPWSLKSLYSPRPLSCK